MWARHSIVVVLAAVLTAGACASSEAAMSADDVEEYVVAAATAMGFDQVRLDGPARRGTYGPDATDVWQVDADVSGGHLELVVERAGRHVLFVRDVADDGTALLDRRQIDVLSDFSANPATDRRRRRLERVATAVAAAMVLALGGVIAMVASGRTSVGGRRRADDAASDRLSS